MSNKLRYMETDWYNKNTVQKLLSQPSSHSLILEKMMYEASPNRIRSCPKAKKFRFGIEELDSYEFDTSIIEIHGRPNSGKTSLCARLANCLEEMNVWYFSHSHLACEHFKDQVVGHERLIVQPVFSLKNIIRVLMPMTNTLIIIEDLSNFLLPLKSKSKDLLLELKMKLYKLSVDNLICITFPLKFNGFPLYYSHWEHFTSAIVTAEAIEVFEGNPVSYYSIK